MEKRIIEEIVNDRINQPNTKILETLIFLTEKHEETKNNIIKLSYELDDVEQYYNKLLEEYKKRNKKWVGQFITEKWRMLWTPQI